MGFENGHLLRGTIVARNAGGDQLVNTFHYDLIDAPATPANDPQTLADLFRDNVIPQWKANISAAWTLDPVLFVDEFDPQNPTAPRGSWTSGTPQAGTKTVGTDALPQFCTALVTLRTSHIGRRFRGRMFLFGTFLEGEQAAGAWGSTFLTGLQTMVNAVPKQPDLATGPSDSVANWCVYSRTQRAADLDPYASAITSATVRSLVHSLRSRAQY